MFATQTRNTEQTWDQKEKLIEYFDDQSDDSDELDEFQISSENEQIDPVLDQEPFTFISRDELQKDIDKIILQMRSLFCVSIDQAILLLIQNKWNIENLTTLYFIDSDVCLRSAGIIKEKEQQHKEKDCPICFSLIQQESSAELPCGHIFCDECIATYICTQFLEGAASIRIGCPNKNCGGKILPSMISQVLASYTGSETSESSSSLQKNQAAEQLNTFIQDDYIQSQRHKLSYCSNPRCVYVAQRQDPLLFNVFCICGTSYCFRCSQDSHFPATCEMMQQWDTIVKPQSQQFRFVLENAKKCPFCHVIIIKDGGCFCMTCKNCKKQFCWTCLQDWSTHKNHFKCNLPPEDQKYENQIPLFLEDGNLDQFYYERVAEQKIALKFAKQQLIDSKVRMDQYKALHNCGDLTAEFIRDSALTLVQCREFIMHSYILTYCLPASQIKKLLQMQIGDLLASTEELCRFQEGRLNRINRLEMMKFNKISQQHLNNLIKYFATDVQELLQISKDLKTNLNDEGKPIQKKEFYDRQYPEQYKEVDQELTDEEMIQIAILNSVGNVNLQNFLDLKETEKEIEKEINYNYYQERETELTEEEMIKIATMISDDNDNWEVYAEQKEEEKEKEIKTDKIKDKENNDENDEQEMTEEEILLFAQKLSLENGTNVSEQDLQKEQEYY
ncbi:MAG: putative ubiquitin-conjugating enzyme E2-binding protein 1 [Streblomastix strix]|uniref:RBR-type E3 ubiquitin transferase n=1 Tax=Streblomastix strix TaxID=222440 RepID=A0A5J4VRM4_9EUKA|nr:MAG: putative ubiquitin-conjugating enzyme E2-binding protein 1 [Streblomastix strix]